MDIGKARQLAEEERKALSCTEQDVVKHFQSKFDALNSTEVVTYLVNPAHLRKFGADGIETILDNAGIPCLPDPDDDGRSTAFIISKSWVSLVEEFDAI